MPKTLTLKKSELTRLNILLHYHYSNCYYYQTSCSPLITSCFGAKFSEKDAREYFLSSVCGDIKDRLGTTIHIPEKSIGFLYKSPEGLHIATSANYEPSRGKRLPWIKHTLLKTNEIFHKHEPSHTIRFHVNEYVIEYKNENGACEKSNEYFFVISKRKKKDIGAPFIFKTAFSITAYNTFLKRIEEFEVPQK